MLLKRFASRKRRKKKNVIEEEKRPIPKITLSNGEFDKSWNIFLLEKIESLEKKVEELSRIIEGTEQVTERVAEVGVHISCTVDGDDD